ncbi:MAG: leucine-rich repeat domain-containing protein, partial [Anaeroplasmataceae bacterium]|nr:leucine-rich repeat domain-containing protein [Anaeroplasmataceae bacterium]
MKKHIFLFTILFFLLLVAGCDEGSKEHTHSYEAAEVIEPTCADEGFTIFACSCGDEYKDKYTQPTGKHEYGEWIIINEAENQNQGLRKHICEVCQHEETETYGHEHTWSVEWSYDENRHWISTNCTDHENLDSRDIGPHTFENGYCTVCNFEENTYGISFSLHNDEYYSVWLGQLTELEEIFIPSEFRGKPVLEIDSYAFSSNDNITSVVISEGIKTIKEHAFSFCKNLTTIAIPDSVISIEDAAFLSCSSLKKVKLPANLTSISSSIFSHCVELENILLPDSILSIADGAFYDCSKLASIELPKNVKSIGRDAFSYCASLQSVTLYRNVERVEKGAFFNCEALEDVNYNTGLIYWCQSWCTISFENEESNPMNYAKHFYAVRSDEERQEITNINVPFDVKEIGEYQFTGFNNVTFIEVTNTVEIIQKGAFHNCNNLEGIHLPFVGRSAADTEQTHFGYIFGATSFEENGDYVPSSLKNVTITGGTTIADSAFGYCRDIKSLLLPSTLNRIGSRAFISTDLEVVIFDGSLEEWCKVELHSTPMNSAAFFLVKEADGVWGPPVNVVIPAEVKAIGDYQFYNVDSITSLEVLGDEISIGTGAFWGCKNLASLILPANVIASYPFSECYNITYAKLPTTVLSEIYKGALKEVEVIGGKRIEDFAFSMGKLEKITIAEGVQFIGASAFEYCHNLSSIVLPDSITSIDNSAFYYCDNLTEINLGNGVTSIGKWTFQECRRLKSIVLPKSLESIGIGAFINCYRLVEIYNLSSLEVTNEEGNIGQYAKVVHTT